MTKVSTTAWTTIGQKDDGRFHLKYQMWADPYDLANNRTYVWRRLLLSIDTYGVMSAVNHSYSGTGMTSASGGSVYLEAGDHVLLSGEGYVSHNSDGTWSQAVTGRAQFGGVYDWTASGTAELETIPRASQPTATKTAEIGNEITLTTNRASSSFTHEVGIKIGNQNVGSIAGVGASTTISTADYASTIVAQASSGKTTITFTVTTKNGSTVIGSGSCASTVTITPSAPSVSASSVAIGNSVTVNTNRLTTTSARTHTVRYKIGSGSYTNLATGVGASTSFNTASYVSALVSAVSSGKTTVTFNCITYVNSVNIGSKTTSTSVAITPSTISCPAVTIGNSATITITRASTTAERTHDITVAFGSTSGGTVATNAKTSATFNSTNFVSSIMTGAGSASSVTATFTATTKIGNTAIGTSTCTAKITINPSVPTVSASPFTIGDSITIATNRTTSARTHTVTAKMGNTTIATFTGVGATRTFNSASYVNAMMDAIGASASYGNVTFIVTTYLSETSIGSKSVSATANVNVDSIKPTITFGTLSDTNTAVNNYHASNAMIKLLSNLSLPITFEVTNTHGETLKSYRITFGGSSQSGTLSSTSGSVTYTYTGVQSDTVTVTVTDTRGVTVSATKTFTLVGYARPTITASEVSRISMTGTDAEFTLKGTAYAGTYSGSSSVTNSLAITYTVQPVGGSSRAGSNTYTKTLSGSGSKTWEQSATFSEQFTNNQQYDITFTVRDAFNAITTGKLRIYNGLPVYGWGEEHFDVYGDFHIHKRSDASERWILPDAFDAMLRHDGQKNLLPCASSSTTVRGVDFTFDTWNRVTVNGTASGETSNSYILYGTFYCQYAGWYTFSGCPIGGSTSTYYLRVQDTSGNLLGSDTGNGVTLNCTYGSAYRVYIMVVRGATVSSLVFKPMVRDAEIVSDTFVRHSASSHSYSITGADIDTLTDAGAYTVSNPTGTLPSSTVTNIQIYVLDSAFTWVNQVAFIGGTIYVRYKSNATTAWTAWKQVTTTAV